VDIYIDACYSGSILAVGKKWIEEHKGVIVKKTLKLGPGYDEYETGTCGNRVVGKLELFDV